MKLNLTPRTSYINSVRSQVHLKTPSLIGELVDNSIDAGATKILIDYQRGKTLSIKDNGCGCDDLEAMLAIGHRKQISERSLGRYGIGAKDAILCLGDKVTIKTVNRRGERRVAQINWPEVKDDATWLVDVPDVQRTTDPSYTSILIEHLVRHDTEKKTLIDFLSRTYYPALGSSLSITVMCNGKVESVQPLPRIELTDESKIPLAEPHGHIIGGIIANREHRNQEGVRVILEGKRVMVNGARWGIPPEAVNLFFEVTLRGDGWTVAKNKDGIDESSIAHIAAAIRKGFAELIAKASQQNQNIELQQLNKTLASIMEQMRGKAKRKERRNATGTVEEKGTGRKHKRAKVIQDGGTLEGITPRLRRISGIAIRFNELAPEDLLFDVCDNVITINKSNPSYDQLFTRKKLDQKLILWMSIMAFFGYTQIKDPASCNLWKELRDESAKAFLRSTDKAIQQIGNSELLAGDTP